MSNIEQAKTFLNALARGDAEAATSYITDDFIVSGPTAQPLGKHEYIEVHKTLAAAMPDFSFNTSDAQEEGNKINLTIQITGTQTGVLDLGRIGLPVPPIQPTGRSVKLPVEHLALTVRNGKFSAMDDTPPIGGGLHGLLSQLGIELPAPTTAHS